MNGKTKIMVITSGVHAIATALKVLLLGAVVFVACSALPLPWFAQNLLFAAIISLQLLLDQRFWNTQAYDRLQWTHLGKEVVLSLLFTLVVYSCVIDILSYENFLNVAGNFTSSLQEELFFRVSLALPLVAFGRLTSSVVVGSLFSIVHYPLYAHQGHYEYLIYAFLFSMVVQWLYFRYNSFALIVCLHVLVNYLSEFFFP